MEEVENENPSISIAGKQCTITFGGDTVSLKAYRGLRDLYYLVSTPEREISAMSLWQCGQTPPSSGGTGRIQEDGLFISNPFRRIEADRRHLRPREKAFRAVKKRIKEVIRRINTLSATLASHFQENITFGVQLVYKKKR